MKKTKNKMGIMHYLNRHKLAVIFYILLVVGASVLSGVATILFSNFLSITIMGNFARSLRFLIYAGSALVAERFCWWISYHLYVKATNLMWMEIAKDLTKQSFRLSNSNFAENGSGGFMQHIMQDPNNVLNNLSYLVENFAQVTTGIIILIYIVSLNALIGAIYITIVFALFILELYRKKVNKKLKTKTKKVDDKTYSLVKEIVESQKDIRALNLEEKLCITTSEKFDNLRHAKNKENVIDTHFWNIRCLILEVFGILVLVLGLKMMRTEMLTLATYVLIFSYRDNLYSLIWYVGDIAKCLTEVQVSSRRMFSLYDENLYPTEHFGDRDIVNLKGKIEFKNVEFSYSEVQENDEEDVSFKKRKPIERIKKESIFKGLSFKIKPNTTVAFVGRSGSGKSTILSLMSKLNDADKGEIKIDNINIKDLSKDCLRENISLINQFPYIFDMTIKENLLLVKKDATDEEIWNVLKRASFDEDVKAMPKGINTKVGESGVKLSGGQRQRLAIARALLKESKIILFDESTSSLDNFAQSHIQQSIEQMKGQHTIVIVAHRLSTIKNVDKIYFLEDGKIADSGTFDELFENNKQFKKMFLMENIETKN